MVLPAHLGDLLSPRERDRVRQRPLALKLPRDCPPCPPASRQHGPAALRPTSSPPLSSLCPSGASVCGSSVSSSCGIPWLLWKQHRMSLLCPQILPSVDSGDPLHPGSVPSRSLPQGLLLWSTTMTSTWGCCSGSAPLRPTRPPLAISGILI